MTEEIFNMVRSMPILQGHAHRMKCDRSDQKVQIQLNLYQEILPL